MMSGMESELKWLRHCSEVCDEAKIDAYEGLSLFDKTDLKAQALVNLYEAAKDFAAVCEADKDFVSLYKSHKACEECLRERAKSE